MGLLALGGHFMWKGFTIFEHVSFGSLYIMACLFEEVAVYKPCTSKPANRSDDRSIKTDGLMGGREGTASRLFRISHGSRSRSCALMIPKRGGSDWDIDMLVFRLQVKV